MRTRVRQGAALTAACAIGLALAGPASAAVPFKTISSPGPLTAVHIGAEGSCQIAHTGDARLELFPPAATPGDCGTFLVAGPTLFAPDFANHDGTATSGLGATTPFTPVSQSDVTGAGTAASPFRLVTVYAAGAAGLQVTETDTYITGQEVYRTDVQVTNTGGGPQSGVLYRAGDCFLQDTDVGFGFVENGVGPGCAANANNTPPGRIEQWFPLTTGSSHMQGRFSAVWAAIGTHNPLPNTNAAGEQLDNGAGLSWPYSVAPGASVTFSHLTAFSPAGVTAGQQQQAATRPATAFGRNGVLAVPSNRRCFSRRVFRIRVRKRRGLVYEQVIVFVNRRRVAVRRGARVTAPVDLRGLPKGRFTVTITVITSAGQVIRGVRRYRTCTKKRRSGRRGPL
jgi:hypothetical protein